MALNLRQQRFVDAYLLEPNATKAAITAGYSEKTAAAIGSENLQKPEIADAIRSHQAKASEKAGLTLEAHLDRLNALADQAAAAEQFGPAVTAEVSRGKAVGFYVEKREHSGSVAMRVEIVREGRRRKS